MWSRNADLADFARQRGLVEGPFITDDRFFDALTDLSGIREKRHSREGFGAAARRRKFAGVY
jgi:hypothetical protein